ncbi:MAG: stage II sporulation protein P [Clostridia bacterium]|nr:stage II sporulation protein P [Clostridia bacterium]
MKKSFIISFQTILQRFFLFLLIGTIGFGCVYYEVPTRLFTKMAAESLTSDKKTIQKQLKTLFSFGFSQTVLAAMPVTPAVSQPVVTQPIPKNTPAPTAGPTPAPRDVSQQANTSQIIQVKNHAQKTFSVEELLAKPLPYQPNTGGYKVLVVHTHTTESYFPDDRSNDETKNMIQVGKEFTAVLEANGIQTLHITKVHDVPYTTSYKKSLESITNALQEHPTIEVVIDLHRDALYNENNEKIKPLATVNQISAAQVMIVTGTEKGGLPHPNWEENLSFAVKIQNNLLKNYPGLSRPVDLREERFNTHTTKNSVILEIGSNGNTIEEAISGAKFAAQSVANVLLGK